MLKTKLKNNAGLEPLTLQLVNWRANQLRY